MRYDHLASQLRRWPERYLWFGPYWWSIKRALGRAGYDFGPSDDPGTRGLIERACGGPEAAERRAMQVYTQNTGALRNHAFTLPDGEPYFLHDEDVTAHAVT
ncbi:hypothetical protein Dgeo_3019 (plasmid) [Deinococcus geothermalis DSM 11300]|uniref:Uncharacterized protein n=1 Tax=Deinococcus geothermalis (strain DSM 11300 / CIP 105573 / AG-3a) TaxID=319795 RepID=A8ZRF1_DEIGD|nr:hypothetical protein [Deinococcus geothermalis]ABW35060.1 hypothetical protein Dgeo_3019 [Deinococcus geothermalis DSM 11300]